MKSSKHLSKKREKSFKKVLLIGLVLLCSVTIYTIIKKQDQKKAELVEERYFTGDINTVNYAANLLDKIEGKNTIYSPYNMKEALILLYKIADNKTKEEIESYLQEEPKEESTSLKINTKYNINKTYEKLYLNYIEELKKTEYLTKSINTLRSLETTDKENLLVLINQINMSYASMIGEQSYAVKSIQKYKITKEDKQKNVNQLKSMLNKIADTYETYEIKKEIKNINYLYYNQEKYTKKDINSSFINKLEKTTQQKIKSFSKEINNINEQIKQDTNEKIKYIIDDIDLENSSLLSLNTLYFNANWEENIEKKRIQYMEFENKEKERQIAEMMYDYAEEYYENEYAIAFKKDFEGQDYSFVGILPKQENASASSLDIDNLLQNKIEEKTLIGIPKFSITKEINCKQLLENNIKEIFTPNADLKKMTTKEMFVDVMKQKISLTIAEKGTKTSEIISTDLETIALEKNTKEIVLNKPFYFLIIRKETNDIFFFGKIETLKND